MMHIIFHMGYNGSRRIDAMYATGNKKMLNMLILQILEEYSDESHRLSQQEIIRLLKLNYGMECDRRSAKNNIDYLKELGYEISTDKNKGCYLINRVFDNAELRLLIDSVLCSRNMTNTQAHDLIEKLIAQGNRYFSPQVAHVHNLPDMQHKDNAEMFLAIEDINRAIAEKKKVSFVYSAYDIDFGLKPKRQDKYVVNPYQLVVANGFYYLIGNYDKYDDVSHYRLDKISDVDILDIKVKSMKNVKGLEHGLDLPKHMAEHVYMYGGESILTELDVPQNMMNELVDWFGKDFKIISKSNGRMIIKVRCNEQAMVYWALQYGSFVEVLAPESLRNKVTEHVKDMAQKYT